MRLASFYFRQKSAYVMSISDWSSDVCSSDLVALGQRPREDFDLAIVETEAAIDGGDLRLDRALVRQQGAGLAALDDGRRDRRAVDVGERLRGEDDAGVLLAQRLDRKSTRLNSSH